MEYEFRVAGQNHVGFGQESIRPFLTPEGVPTGPPTNLSFHFQVNFDLFLLYHNKTLSLNSEISG